MVKRGKAPAKRVRAAPKTKAPKKAQKIAKTKTGKRQASGASNPRKGKSKSGRGRQAPGQVRYYTVGEDSRILEALRAQDSNTTKSQLAIDLANSLDRSVESVRDRIKRYISKLSTADSKEVLKQAKKNPDNYLYFKGKDGAKKIEKCGAEAPVLNTRDIVRRPRVGAKGKKATKAKKADFNWILRKVKASDPYFALDHSVHLLNAVFGRLMEDGVTRRQVENFINNAEGETTLYEVLNALAQK